MTLPTSQDKAREIAFFDSHGAADAYDVFSPNTNERLIDTVVRLSGLPAGSHIVDLGCGSGVFTHVLQQRGYRCTGIDLSPNLIAIARAKYSGIEFLEGDIEKLPFADGSVDGIMFSGVLHHLPDCTTTAAEAFRVLRPGGKFVAFDPNRMNPFMYLYRDRSSPFYSPVGVTANERPVLAGNIAATFRKAGFRVGSEFLSGLKYRYIASGKVRWLLPLYNTIDSLMFSPAFMQRFRAFVISYGEKP